MKTVSARRGHLGAALLLLAAALAAGCGGRADRGEAEGLAQWMQRQSYSVWSTFRRRDRTPHQPESPDGLTLGSPNIFAGIGCDPEDLTSLDILWADGRSTRPLGRPLTVSVRTGNEEPRRLADFADQELRRVRHTAIAVSQSEEAGLRVSCVDFAPLGEEDNFLVRWFLVENAGDSAQRVSLVFDVFAPGDWARQGDRVWRRGDGLAVVSDTRLKAGGDTLEAALGRLGAGEKRAAAVLLVGVREAERLPQSVERAQAAAARLMELLEATRAGWEEWRGETRLTTGDERTDDLLDSLLCLVLTHVGPEGIHTGSLRYPHDRAWVRDNYWVQRALLELGRAEEARRGLEFFRRAWQSSRVASSYQIPGGEARSWGYQRVELPHYLVLMVRDAERLGGAEGAQYWDMVRGCLDGAAVPESGRQPMNGDETWLLAAPVRELDDLLDNSWLLIASAEYGAELAARVGDAERAARYRATASRARAAAREFAPREDEAEGYAIGRSGDGSLDFSLCPEVLARAAMLGVLPATDPRLVNGLVSGWERLSFQRGLRTHSRSATISGGTPGYVLHAAADSPVCDYLFNRELARRALEFCSATGCVWEFHDLHDPAWGGEKRRLWDSAVLLMGLVHALFDAERAGREVEFVPKVEPEALLIEEIAPSGLTARQAQELIAKSGPAPILHRGAPEHAARLARELARQTNRQHAVAAYGNAPPEHLSAIIVSAEPPPTGWSRARRGYWVRDWEGPAQVWVTSKGEVYRDTDPLLADLLSLLTPQREQPLPYPDASLDLAARLGEVPSGEAELSVASEAGGARGRLDLAGDRAELEVGEAVVVVQAAPEREARVVEFTLTATGRRPALEATVTLPAGWWVVRARDMTGKWDRVGDPVKQVRMADGRMRLIYSLRASEQTVGLTFHLARLKVEGE